MTTSKRTHLKGTVMALGAAVALAGAVVSTNPAAAACAPCKPAATSPCAAKNPCNPCAAKNPCNPCAAKNPCAARNPCNPCAAKNPCTAKSY